MRHSIYPYPLTTTVILLAAAVLSQACSSTPDAPPSMSISKTCQQSQCDAKIDSDSAACSRCMSACVDADFDCDPSSSCEISCSPSNGCSDTDRATCAQQNFSVTIAAQPNKELEDACNRFLDHAIGCGVDVAKAGFSTATCTTWAEVERPELASAYDCVTNLDCGSTDTSSCAPPETRLGYDICDALAGKCGSPVCSDDLRDALDGDGGWVKDDVIAAGKTCLNEATCDDASKCINAWVDGAKL